MAFQNYVFTVVGKYKYIDRLQNHGIFSNFKEAYEEIERHAGNLELKIKEKDPLSETSIIGFELYDKRNRLYKDMFIIRELLTVFPETQTVSYEMVNKIREANKKHCETYKMAYDTF